MDYHCTIKTAKIELYFGFYSILKLMIDENF